MFKRKTQIAELTSAAYIRWLRAKSPQPLAFFLGLAELEQEALALLGDEYTEDCHLSAAFAMRDPQALLQDRDATDEEREEAAAAKLAGGQHIEQIDAPSMSGVSERRDAMQVARVQNADNQKSLLGRKPDTVREEVKA